MKTDEQAIQELVETWLEATKRGDFETVLSLMDDDVVFIVPGQARDANLVMPQGNTARK